jgi:hypothetical protein
MPFNSPRWICPECSLSQRVTVSGKIITHYLDNVACPGSGLPAYTAPIGDGPATSFFFLVTGTGASQQLRGRMAPRSQNPLLVVEAVDAKRGEIVAVELTADLVREWDAQLCLWAQWAASPAIQTAHRLVAATPESDSADGAPLHVPAAPELVDIHDARGTRLAAMTPRPRTPTLAVGISRTRRPANHTFVVLDLLEVHNMRCGLQRWLDWVDRLTHGGLLPS